MYAIYEISALNRTTKITKETLGERVGVMDEDDARDGTANERKLDAGPFEVTVWIFRRAQARIRVRVVHGGGEANDEDGTYVTEGRRMWVAITILVLGKLTAT